MAAYRCRRTSITTRRSVRIDTTYDYNNGSQLLEEKELAHNLNFRYDYDAMARLGFVRRFVDIAPGNRQYWNLAENISFNAADQLLTMSYLGFNESRGYNSLLQLTSISGSGTGLPSLNLSYNFPAGTNNGQISSMGSNGESISYIYDSLRRLTNATGSGWSQGFSYDGFGNLHTRTGMNAFALTLNSANNRFLNFVYDANGNVTNDGTRVYTYDLADRMLTNGLGKRYEYAPDNRRVFDGDNYTLWTPDGRRFGKFRLATTPVQQNGQWVLPFTPVEVRAHFGGRLIGTAPESNPTAFVPVVLDRLGSVRIRGIQTLNYYPYGEERVVTTNGVDKFGGYIRDANGLDYADQRYYTSQFGRFLTADPAVVDSNRYAYVGGDPINNIDPTGENLAMLECGAGGDSFAGGFSATSFGSGGGCGGGGGFGPTYVLDGVPTTRDRFEAVGSLGGFEAAYGSGGGTYASNGAVNTAVTGNTSQVSINFVDENGGSLSWAYDPRTISTPQNSWWDTAHQIDAAIGAFAETYINPIANNPIVDTVTTIGSFLPIGMVEGGLTKAMGIAEAGLIDTAAVRFTQNSIRSTFRNGESLTEVANALRGSGGDALASQFSPIRLIEKDGLLYTLDNRRLAVFSAAGRDIPYRMATEAEILAEWSSKFTTTQAQGWGRFITIR